MRFRDGELSSSGLRLRGVVKPLALPTRGSGLDTGGPGTEAISLTGVLMSEIKD